MGKHILSDICSLVKTFGIPEGVNTMPEAAKKTVEMISQLPEEIQNEELRSLAKVADALDIYGPALKRRIARALGMTVDELERKLSKEAQ